jgi:hypothetical protein
MTAWNNAVGTINSMRENDGKYPVSLNVHLRFVKNSDSLLSPANQTDAATHTYIEFLSFSEQLEDFIPYSATVGKDWAALGGLPHWAKIFQLVPDAYQQTHRLLEERNLLQPFLALRGELDPGDIFMNDFLNQLLNGTASGAVKTLTARQPVSAAAAASNVARQFRLTNPRALERFTVGKDTAWQTSERGCYLIHDPDSNPAMLIDEHGTSNLLQYDVGPANDLVTYCPLVSSKFLSPNEILTRVGEVLKAAAAPAPENT